MKLHVKLLSFAAIFAAFMTSCVNEGLQDPQDAEILNMIPALEEQAAAVEASVKDLQNLQTELEAADTELSGAVVEVLEQHVADLKKGGMSLEEGTFATFELQKQLGAVVGSALAELDADNKLMRSFNALEKGVKAWVGENFDALYPAAVAEARVKASVAKFDSKLGNQKLYVDALLSDVEAGLREDENPEELKSLAASVEETLASSEKLSEDLAALAAKVEREYEAAVKAMSADPAGFDAEALAEFNASARAQFASTDTNLSDLIARVATCESQLSNILERLGALEGVVEDLEGLLGMIQSVTLLTDFSSEAAVAYYNMGTSTTSEGYKVRNPQSTIGLSYVVRPASAASALTASSLWNNGLKVFGYYANRIEQSAVGEFVNFNIKGVTANATTGVVNVTVENNLQSDFYYKKVGAKMALSVTTGKTDLTSKFVEIVPKDASNTVYLERLSLSKDYVEFDEGEELNLSAIVTPSNVTNSEMVWTSANNDIVSVSGTGRLTAKAVGTTTVTATSKGTDEWGRTLSASCTVKVNPAIRLSGPSYVEVGKSVEMSLDYPASMAIESKEWSTSDASKATISTAGVVTGVGHTYNTSKNDYDTITVYCKINGTTTVSHEMKVVVTQPTSIKLNNYADNVSEITIKVDESLDLGASIVPSVPADQFRLYYSSTSATGLGWVDSSSGKINEYKNTLPVENVYVYIDVKDYDQSHYFAPGRSLRRTVIVKVQPYYVANLTLPETLTLAPDAVATLSPVFTSDVEGKQPTNTTLTWTSSNPSIVSINSTTGEMKALAEGTVIITATTASGTTSNSTPKSATCTVTVKKPVAPVHVGDYYYSDGTWSTELNSSKTVIGVVFATVNAAASDNHLATDYPKCNNGLVLSLEEYTSKMIADRGWGRTDCTNWWDRNGYTTYGNTSQSVGYSNTKAHEAVNAASIQSYGYTVDWTLFNSSSPFATHKTRVATPSSASSWYVPSFAEMQLIKQNLDVINSAIGRVSGGDKVSSDLYWCSTHRDFASGWYNSFSMNSNGWSAASTQYSTSLPFRVALAF